MKTELIHSLTEHFEAHAQRTETLPAAEDVKKVARRLALEGKTRAENPDALDS